MIKIGTERIMNDAFQVIRHGDYDHYLLLADEININETNQEGQGLLHEAIASNQEQIAQDLIAKGIDINLEDPNRQTALHYLSFYMNIRVAEMILRQGGNVSVKDKYGNTPLWYAVFNAKGNYEYVKLLLKYKADVMIKNNAGKSPLDFANQINDTKLINILSNEI